MTKWLGMSSSVWIKVFAQEAPRMLSRRHFLTLLSLFLTSQAITLAGKDYFHRRCKSCHIDLVQRMGCILSRSKI